MGMSETLEIEITEEQKQRLEDGETFQICTDIREPLGDREVPTSINVIELMITTRGLAGRLQSAEELPEVFDEVEGVEEKLAEEGYIDG
jgi:hypothetical protein